LRSNNYDGQIQNRIARELDELREKSQFRTLEIPRGMNLCSNDYLGLARDPRLKQALAEAASCAQRVGSTGSRLMSGNAREWEELELEFAEFAGTEAALYFGSGYAANVGLLCAVLKPHDVVFSDELNHASIIDGIRLSAARRVVYPHADLDHLDRALREHQASSGAKVIVTESLFSMEGDVAPLDTLLRLAKNYGAEIIVDEAHATGVCGPQGRGLVAERGSQREMLAVLHACGKALASAGAFVCCGSAMRNYLINRARTFIFSTAMPPHLAGQIHAALGLAIAADDRRAHLREISAALREALASAGLSFGASSTQIIPVILGTNEWALAVAAALKDHGFAVKAIRPPTVPAGTSRIRLSLTSEISTEDVRRLASTVAAACKSLPQTPSVSAVHA